MPSISFFVLIFLINAVTPNNRLSVGADVAIALKNHFPWSESLQNRIPWERKFKELIKEARIKLNLPSEAQLDDFVEDIYYELHRQLESLYNFTSGAKFFSPNEEERPIDGYDRNDFEQYSGSGYGYRNRDSNPSFSEPPFHFLTSTNVFLNLTRWQYAANSDIFNYQEQNLWPEHFPACGGTSQSPINLIVSDSTIVGTRPSLQWIGYLTIKPGLKIASDDHTVEAWATWNKGFGLNGNIRPMITEGPLNGIYLLQRIHFHWGSTNADGSEHAIDSKKHALEAHFVHYNSKYSDIQEAVNSNDPEALAVVAVLYRRGFYPNWGISATANAIERAIINNQTLGENTILPLYNFGVGFKNHYFTYRGSLTTPRCAQIVRWIVNANIQDITDRQLKIFRAIEDSYGNKLYNNFRYTQPLNGRKVFLVG